MILDVVQSGAPQTIAKLVNITPISLWFMVLHNYSYVHLYSLF